MWSKVTDCTTNVFFDGAFPIVRKRHWYIPGLEEGRYDPHDGKQKFLAHAQCKYISFKWDPPIGLKYPKNQYSFVGFVEVWECWPFVPHYPVLLPGLDKLISHHVPASFNQIRDFYNSSKTFTDFYIFSTGYWHATGFLGPDDWYQFNCDFFVPVLAGQPYP
jgi:hypothetical protein